MATCVERAVCAACGAAYGAVDSKNHTALVKVNGRPATPTQVGYVTCWTCEDCGRYFRDAAGTQEIRKEDASIGKAEAAGASGGVRSARTADEGAVGLWIACGQWRGDGPGRRCHPPQAAARGVSARQILIPSHWEG